MSLLVVISPLQDGSAPLSQQSLRHSLDARLGLLASSVEEDHLANTAAKERLLLNVQSGERHKDVALDIIGRERSVVKGLEEEFDVLKEIGIGVQHRVLHIVAVENGCDFGQQLELVKGRLAGFARLVISLTRALHLDLEVRQLLIDLVFEVLEGSAC